MLNANMSLSQMHVGLHAMLAFVLSGCFSVPTARPLTPLEGQTASSIRPSMHRVLVQGCMPDPPRDQFPSCNQMTSIVANDLSATGLFAEALATKDQPAPGDFVALVRSLDARPYFATPGHNPGFFLLSAAIPFWWSEPFGYRFSITEPISGRSIEVDTKRDGVVIMWGMASLLNLSGTRAMSSDRGLEVAHVKVQLAELLSDKPSK